jgi:hypothetical protein
MSKYSMDYSNVTRMKTKNKNSCSCEVYIKVEKKNQDTKYKQTKYIMC